MQFSERSSGGHVGVAHTIFGKHTGPGSLEILGSPGFVRERPPLWRAALVGIVAAVIGGAALGFALRVDPDTEQYELSYQVKVLDLKNGVLQVRLHAEGMRSPNLYLTTVVVSPDQNRLSARFRLREARDLNGHDTPVEAQDDYWKIRAKGGGIDLRYEVWLRAGIDTGVFSRQMLSDITETSARLVGSDIFIIPVFGDLRNIRVEYTLPPHWELVHPFQCTATAAVVPDVKSLYHSAVGMGRLRTLERTVRGCRLRVAVTGRYDFQDRDLLAVLSQLAGIQMDIFGGPLRDEYVFLVGPHPESGDPEILHYFGLHYDGSMILLIDTNTDRKRLQQEPAQLCAHEFYHNWCGELIRQHRYDMNWFIEGVTEFYAYQTRLEAGMLSFPDYASVLSDRFHREYEVHPLRGKISLAQASKKVLIDRETTRYTYSGGLFVAAGLDEQIDDVTRQQESLDDLMYDLAVRAQRDPDFVLTRQTLEAALLDLTGHDFHEWFDRYVYGLESPHLPGYITQQMALR